MTTVQRVRGAPGLRAALLAGACGLLAVGRGGADPPTAAAGRTPLCAAGETAPEPEPGSVLAAGAEALAAWIVDARETALQQGVEPVPGPVRSRLAGFVPGAVLERVRWRSGDGPLQYYLESLGLVAVTLDDVIVFRERAVALDNAGLWAHELRHVMQYEDCGVAGFARAYLEDYQGLEADAADYARRWHQWRMDAWLQGVTGDDR